MADDINNNNGQVVPTDNESEGGERSEKRFKDLSDKVKAISEEKEALTKQKDEELAKERAEKADLKFRADFLELSSKYPNAKEFEKDIKDKTSRGYVMEDAIISTLASKGKLGTVAPTRSESMGGSSPTIISETKKDDPSFGGDRAKLRAEFLELEKKGEIQYR